MQFCRFGLKQIRSKVRKRISVWAKHLKKTKLTSTLHLGHFSGWFRASAFQNVAAKMDHDAHSIVTVAEPYFSHGTKRRKEKHPPLPGWNKAGLRKSWD